MQTQQETVQVEAKVPDEIESYVNKKLEKNGSGGRPHIIQVFKNQGKNPVDEVYNILEYAWVKNRSLGSIAKKYEVEYTTIYRVIKDLETSKQQIVNFLLQTPRRKQFYNPQTDNSDYETIQAYIKRAHRKKLKHYRELLNVAEKAWKTFNYKDPANWNADDIIIYLDTLSDGSQYHTLVAIRQIAPQIASDGNLDNVSTQIYKDKLKLHKKDIFQIEVKLIRTALAKSSLTYHLLVFDLHITTGAREGTDGKAGMASINWKFFKKDFSTLDLFESKAKGGIWCRDCPINLFFPDLPERLKQLWIKRGKPDDAKLILKGYNHDLLPIYREINKAVAKYYEGKLEPSLLHEISHLKPHDADRIHVNLLWEAGVPLEVVSGEYLGSGEGQGLVGRIWLDINTIRKHYLSLTTRSKNYKNMLYKISIYAQNFNGESA